MIMKKIIWLLCLCRILWIWSFVFAEQASFTSSNRTVTVDLDLFQKNRLAKVNGARASVKLPAYKANTGLDMSAQAWSNTSKAAGLITHQKYGSKLYYDYKLIQKYVESIGVKFSKKSGTKVVENIGRGYVKCPKENKSDCTSQIIAATEATWKLFIGEKKYNGSHYRSIVSKQYTDAWFGVSIDPKTGKYFLTAYYSVPTTN